MSDNFSSLNFSEQENYSATATAEVSTVTVSTRTASSIVVSTTSTAVESAATSVSAWRLPQEVATSINAIAKITKIFFIVQILILNLIKNVAGKVGFEPTNFSLTLLTFKPFDATVNHDYCLQRIAITAIIFLKTSCPL